MKLNIKDRVCPKCPKHDNVVLNTPAGDGNIVGLCGHVWKADESR